VSEEKIERLAYWFEFQSDDDKDRIVRLMELSKEERILFFKKAIEITHGYIPRTGVSENIDNQTSKTLEEKR